MLQEAADWLDAFDRDPDSGVLLEARDHIAALVAEVAKLQSEIIALKDEDTKVLRMYDRLALESSQRDNLAAELLCHCKREVADLGREVVELREGKVKAIRKAWYASGAWNLGGMMGFVQRHPNLDEYLKRELGGGAS